MGSALEIPLGVIGPPVSMEAQLLEVARQICILPGSPPLVRYDEPGHHFYKWRFSDAEERLEMEEVSVRGKVTDPNFRIRQARLFAGDNDLLVGLRVTMPGFRFTESKNGLPITNKDPIAVYVLQSFKRYLRNPPQIDNDNDHKPTRRWWHNLQKLQND